MDPKGLGLVLGGLLTLLSGCGSPPELGCIIPPPSLTEYQEQTAIDIAAELEALPYGGDLKTDFEEAMVIHFDRMEDPNVCLFLFLKALECYMEQGEIGGEVARELSASVLTNWEARCGLTSQPRFFTPGQLEELEDSRHQERIHRTWRAIGNR